MRDDNEGLTEDEIANAIDREIEVASGNDDTKLSDQRSNAMDYYFGEPYGNERRGKSQVVTREVMDTIEWVKPELMKLFSSGGETVRFEPQGPEDVQGAQQATDYVNYLFHRKNPGFKILYEWITDGLLQKNGVVKCWWDQDRSTSREEYAGLSDIQLQMLMSNENTELLEHEVTQVQGPQGPVNVNSVAVAIQGAQTGLTIEPIPPEEFLISRKAKTIQSSPFCCHRTRMTISDLNAMGYDTTDLDAGATTNTGTAWQEESIARHRYDDTNPDDWDTVSADPSMREVWVDEAYIRMDANGDGIAELLKVIKVNNTILDQAEVEHMPFAGWTPIIVSHKFHGLSLADLVMDLQRLHSQLFRNMLDNQYMTNNGKYAVLENMVNLDDLLAEHDGHSAVRIKTPGAVTPLQTPQLGATAFQMLEYVDRLRERRTGVSERTQGLDPNALGPNTAAGAVNQVMTASQQRIELIARVFGETGLKDLFYIIYKEVLQNATQKDIFRLNQEYVEVDPREWKERKDLSAVVGLGNGSKDNEMMQLQSVLQNQMMMLSNPTTAGIVSPANVFNASEDMVKVLNRAAVGRYYTNPQSQEAQQRQQQNQQMQQQEKQKQDAAMAKQMELAEREVVVKETEAQSDGQRKQSQSLTDEQELIDKMEIHEDELALSTAELQLEAELEAKQNRGVSLGN